MGRYLITLTPLGLFFFGGEQTFGDGTNLNYFARSTPFPQQTALLGMLRKEVLIQSKIFKENRQYDDQDKAKMNVLIGPESFSMDKHDQDFGVIQSLSPVFLRRENQFFITTPLDTGLVLDPPGGRGRAFLDREIPDIPRIRGWQAKTGLPDSFSSPGSKTAVAFGEVFKSKTKIGIDKDRSEDEEGKFFKQQCFTLAEGFSFAFFADLAMDLANAIVFVGADGSAFSMAVEKAKGKSFDKIFCQNPTPDRITLVSDAAADPLIYNDCWFAITQTRDFRNIRTSSGNYAFKKGRSKSVKHTLLGRGSVLYATDKHSLAAITSHLDKASLQKIGYNYYT